MKDVHVSQNLGEDIEQIYRESQDSPLRVLVRLYKGNYLNLALSVFFFVLKHSPVWVLPLVTADIINIITSGTPADFSRIIWMLVLMAALVAQNILTSHLHVHFKSIAVRHVEAALRASLVRKLQHLSILYHKQMPGGRLQSKIMRDVEAVETLSTQLFISMINIILSIVIALGITLARSWVVFVFFLVTVPIAGMVVFLFRGKMKESNGQFRKEVENTSGQVMEMMELIPITRAHGLEEEELKKMSGHLEQVAERGYRLDILQNLFGATGWVVFQVSQLVCLGFTAYLALQGNIQAGDVVLYQTYFTTIVTQITSIMNLVPMLAKGFESLTSIGEVMLSNDEESYEGKKKVEEVKGAFDFKDVSYHYPNTKKPVLNHFNLQVQPGETIAFVGESGAGKSTVLNLIIGFMKPDTGEIYLDGQPMSELDFRSFRTHLAVVPQSTVLFSGTIRDNITYGLKNVSDDELWEVLEAANLAQIVRELPEGLETRLGEHGDRLSGGQKQRISIARAFLRNPEVIILDEATSALDSISEQKIQEAFRRLSKGKTTFMVAHRLSTIRNADRIVLVENGQCKESGTYEELMEKHGKFYEMQQAQKG